MIAKITTLLVAVLHLVFMVVEAFLWTTPAIRERFGQSVEQAEATRVLAANQGVYNGALGLALAWAALTGNTTVAKVLLVFVIVVGLYGGATAKPSIFVLQALPAAIALLFTMLRK